MTPYNDGIERCPKCQSLFIQYDEVKDELYCLEKQCNNRWSSDIDDFYNIKNPYLRNSIKRIPA